MSFKIYDYPIILLFEEHTNFHSIDICYDLMVSTRNSIFIFRFVCVNRCVQGLENVELIMICLEIRTIYGKNSSEAILWYCEDTVKF